MKHNKVLHRPMFDAQNSAYGRGITSNLVTEEQRVKYNTGGRVRLAEGTPGYGFKDFRESPVGGFFGDMYRNVPGAIADFAYTPINLAGRLFGYNPGLSARKHIRTSKDLMYGKDREDRMTDEEVEKTSFIGIPFSAKRGFTSERRRKEQENLEEKPDDIEVVEAEVKVDPKSDTLDWTDQERKEKMGQILLKGGQRLVSGARDKWGSKEQMKNVGDWLGDVAAIGDKTELRKEERKYQAWAKAKKGIARDVQAATLEYNNLRAQGVSEVKALDISTGGKIKAKTIPSKTNQKLRDKSLEATQKGDIIYDEDIQAFSLSGYVDEETGRSKPVPRGKLLEVQKIFLKQGA